MQKHRKCQRFQSKTHYLKILILQGYVCGNHTDDSCKDNTHTLKHTDTHDFKYIDNSQTKHELLAKIRTGRLLPSVYRCVQGAWGWGAGVYPFFLHLPPAGAHYAWASSKSKVQHNWKDNAVSKTLIVCLRCNRNKDIHWRA